MNAIFMLLFVVVFRNCLVAFGSNAIYWSGKKQRIFVSNALLKLHIIQHNLQQRCWLLLMHSGEFVIPYA